MATIIEVRVLVDGGKASGGPPLGPAIGPTGVPINQVIAAINEKTKEFAGLKVPVTVLVNKDEKKFDIVVELPMTSALIFKELKMEKGSGNPSTELKGNLSWDQLFKIARMKKASMTAVSFKAAVLTVIGTAQSCGVTVEKMTGKEITKKIKSGEFDQIIEKGEKE